MDELDRVVQGLSRIADPKALLEGLFAFAPVGFQIFSVEGRSVVTNRAFRAIFGSEPPPDYCIFQDEIAAASGLQPLIRRAFAGETVHIPLFWSDPRDLKHVDVREGRRVAIEFTAVPLLDHAGKVGYVALVFKDVTERETLEGQLRQSGKMEAVGRLAGGVAHDFNNLLTVIQGYIDLLMPDLDGPQAACAREARTAAERAAKLTHQLLAFSRKQVLQPKVIDLNASIKGLRSALLPLIGEDIELVLSLQPDLGRVLADPIQIEQVVLNLAINSRDAMPKGGRLVVETKDIDLDASYARTHPEIMPGRYVMAAVTDSGTGMDAETVSHIFEPFFTTKERGHGTGLGLSTVYGIVRQSGGHIWVYSEPGKGTTFKVYFPRSEGAEAPAASGSVPRPGRGTETILLVEDEEPLRKLGRTVLERAGYAVLEAADGAEGLVRAANHDGPIPLAITDVIMPVMDGRAFAERLRAVRPDTRVLFMSGYAEDAIVHQGRLDAGTLFLQKPFSPASLAAKVRSVLDGETNA